MIITAHEEDDIYPSVPDEGFISFEPKRRD